MITKVLAVLLLAGVGTASGDHNLAETKEKTVEQATVPQRTPPTAQFQSSEAAVAVYRQGWIATMNQLSESGTHPKRISPRLGKMLSDIRPVMAWGHLQQDDIMSALSNGSRNGIWVIVIDPGHPRLEQAGPTMRTIDENGITVIMVRPDLLTARWAGIFLVHEMSHALDQREAPDKNGCALEFDAYRVEREALNRLTEGRFDRILDVEIGRQGYANAGDVLRQLSQPSQDAFAQVLDSIERALSEPAALSSAEREMRDGFYLMSLIDRVNEKANLDAARRCSEMSAAIKSASKY